MKGLLKASDMKKIMASMEPEDQAEMVNAMMYECAAATYEKYEQLREMVNNGTVSKEMMVHENKTTQFGERLETGNMQAMYKQGKQHMMEMVGKRIKEFADNELNEDVQLERRLDQALSEAYDTKELSKYGTVLPTLDNTVAVRVVKNLQAIRKQYGTDPSEFEKGFPVIFSSKANPKTVMWILMKTGTKVKPGDDIKNGKVLMVVDSAKLTESTVERDIDKD